MKKLLYSFLLLTIVFAAGCGKKGIDKQIVGSWTRTAEDGTAITYNFTKDNTFEVKAGDEVKFKGTFSASENGLTLTPEGGDAEKLSEVTFDGKSLSFKDGSGNPVTLTKQ